MLGLSSSVSTSSARSTRKAPCGGFVLIPLGSSCPAQAPENANARRAQTLCTEPAGTHSVRGSLFLCLRGFVRIAVQVRPYISNCSPSVIWRSTAVSWTRPFGYRSAMRVSTGCATLGTFRYRFINAGFSPCKNLRRTSLLTLRGLVAFTVAFEASALPLSDAPEWPGLAGLRRCSGGLEQTQTDVLQTPARVNRTQKRLPFAVTWHLNIWPGSSSCVTEFAAGAQ